MIEVSDQWKTEVGYRDNYKDILNNRIPSVFKDKSPTQELKIQKKEVMSSKKSLDVNAAENQPQTAFNPNLLKVDELGDNTNSSVSVENVPLKLQHHGPAQSVFINSKSPIAMTLITLKDYAKHQFFQEKKSRDSQVNCVNKLMQDINTKTQTDFTTALSTQSVDLSDLIALTQHKLQQELHDFMAVDPMPPVRIDAIKRELFEDVKNEVCSMSPLLRSKKISSPNSAEGSEDRQIQELTQMSLKGGSDFAEHIAKVYESTQGKIDKLGAHFVAQ